MYQHRNGLDAKPLTTPNQRGHWPPTNRPKKATRISNADHNKPRLYTKCSAPDLTTVRQHGQSCKTKHSTTCHYVQEYGRACTAHALRPRNCAKLAQQNKSTCPLNHSSTQVLQINHAMQGETPGRTYFSPQIFKPPH